MYARLLHRGTTTTICSTARPVVGAASRLTRSGGEGVSAVASAFQKTPLHSGRNTGGGRAIVSAGPLFRRQATKYDDGVPTDPLVFNEGKESPARRHSKACLWSGERSLTSPCGAARPLSTSQKGKGQEEQNGAKPESAGEGAQKAGEDKDQEGDVDEMTALREELAKTEDQLVDTREKALYLAAEMENVRSIAKRDADSARLYAIQKFAKQLLDVADNLERAVASGGEVEEAGGDSAHEQLVLGVKMTSEELQKVFRAQGLVKFGESGDKFDPHLHDAMFEYEDPGQEPGTVGQVLKSGYTLHGRVVRAAQVGTVKAA